MREQQEAVLGSSRRYVEAGELGKREEEQCDKGHKLLVTVTDDGRRSGRGQPTDVCVLIAGPPLDSLKQRHLCGTSHKLPQELPVFAGYLSHPASGR